MREVKTGFMISINTQEQSTMNKINVNLGFVQTCFILPLPTFYRLEPTTIDKVK